MMTTPSDTVQAERHIKFRIFGSTLIAFGMIASYANTFSLVPTGFLDYTHLLSGPFFGMLLMLILANGQERYWSDSPAVQRLLGDESTTENRRRAQAFGFWSAIVFGIMVYVACLYVPIPGPKAAQLVATLALAAAALRFAGLEQAALRP